MHHDADAQLILLLPLPLPLQLLKLMLSAVVSAVAVPSNLFNPGPAIRVSIMAIRSLVATHLEQLHSIVCIVAAYTSGSSLVRLVLKLVCP